MIGDRGSVNNVRLLRAISRYAVRAIRNNPGFSALAVLTLAVGIGVNAVAFTAVNALLFNPFCLQGPTIGSGGLCWRHPGVPRQPVARRFPRSRAGRTRGPSTVVARQGRLPLSIEGPTDARRAGLDADGDRRLFRGARRAAGGGPAAGRSDAARLTSPAVVSHRSGGGRLERGDPIAGQALRSRTARSRSSVCPRRLPGARRIVRAECGSRSRRPRRSASRSRTPAGERWLTTVGRLRGRVEAAQARGDLAAPARSCRMPADDGNDTVAAQARVLPDARGTSGGPRPRAVRLGRDGDRRHRAADRLLQRRGAAASRARPNGSARSASAPRSAPGDRASSASS